MYIADALSSVFTMALMVGAGYMGGRSLNILREDVKRIEHVLVVLAVILLAVYILYRF
jgi:membrane protein DedA with SNARE-associated domain